MAYALVQSPLFSLFHEDPVSLHVAMGRLSNHLQLQLVDRPRRCDFCVNMGVTGRAAVLGKTNAEAM